MEESASIGDRGQKAKSSYSQDSSKGSRDAYFANLNIWVKNANMSQNAMALFPWYLLNSYSQMFQNQVMANSIAMSTAEALRRTQQMARAAGNITATPAPAAAPPQFDSFRILDEQAQVELIHRVGGYEYIVASFWKRFLAELVDTFLLLFLKVITTFTIMNIFGFNLGIDLDNETIKKVLNGDDYSDFMDISLDFLELSTDLLMLDILTKTVVCFYETVFTAMNLGATPGKALLGIHIQYCEAILPLQPALQPPQMGGIQAPRQVIKA